MATVRIQRRAKLAEKLQDVFELKDITEVRAELPCWLLRSVCKSLRICHFQHNAEPKLVLQGYMYLTNSHLCFFAHMPTREVS